MNTESRSSRREFIKTTSRLAGASAFAGMTVPNVHAAGDDTIQLALIGCGSRGTSAVGDALSVKRGPIKLVAMADVFSQRLASSYDHLSKTYGAQVDVPQDRKFIDFDSYRHAMDCLRPGDIAILTTPLAFRPPHFDYAIRKSLHLFMEKPLTADGPSSRHMLKLSAAAEAKSLKVGVGLMSRHSRAIQEAARRIHDGAIGDILLMRGYRMSEAVGSAFSERWPGEPSELLWQISRFHSFIWASGGCFNDFYIHIIDHLCMVKNAWPVKAQALGGRHYRTTPDGKRCVDQNFDSYSVEYTFADGAKLLMDGRCMPGAQKIYSSYAHGSKGMAIVSAHSDCGMPSSIHSSQQPSPANAVWTSNVPNDQSSPYQNEWNDLVDAIRDDRPYSEATRGVEASVVASMGRMAAHTGQQITYDDALNHADCYAPGVEAFTMDSAPPLRSDANGLYPVPQPGVVTDHEYALS